MSNKNKNQYDSLNYLLPPSNTNKWIKKCIFCMQAIFHNGAVDSKNTQALKLVETGKVAIYYNHNKETPFFTNNNSIRQIFLHSSIPDEQQTNIHKPSQHEFDISNIKILLSTTYLSHLMSYQRINQGDLKREEKKSILKIKRKRTQFLLSSSTFSQQPHINNPSTSYQDPYTSSDNVRSTSPSPSSFSSSSSSSSSSASSSPSLYSTFTNFTFQQTKPVDLSARSSLSDETNSYYSASSSSSSIVDSLKLSSKNEKKPTGSFSIPSIHDHQHQCINSSSASSSLSIPSLALSNDTSSALSIAKDIWNEKQTICNHKEITVWLGTSDPFRNYVLQLYINYFDFTGQRLDIAFRTFAKKLYLRAEAQQLDRVIEAFANRFWECNPSEVYYNADIVYVIAYSLLLLNTEFYSAPHSKKMSRSQFIKNTMETILPLLINDEDDVVTSIAHSSTTFLTPTTFTPQEQTSSHSSFTLFSRSQSFLYPKTKNESNKSLFQHYKSQSLIDLAACLHKQDKKMNNFYFSANQKGWIIQMESLLKSLYKSIKENEIVLCTSIKKPDDFANLVPNLKGALPKNRGKGLSSLSTTTFSNYLKSIKWISKLKKEKDQMDLL
ncbi:unnamed protein product [Cunninghamella echinulata]